MKKINWTLIIIFLMVLGCGKKYPLPPEPETGMPSEESYLVVSNTSWDFTRFINLRDIIVGEDGYIYIVDSSSLLKFNVYGDLVDTFCTNLDIPVSCAQDISRNIYILEQGAKRISVYTRDKDFLYEITDTTFGVLRGISVSTDGRIFVSDSLKDLLLEVDSSGVIDTIATPGNGILQVDDPMGIFADQERNRILVASMGHNWVEGISLTEPRYSVNHLGGLTHSGGSDEGFFLRPVDVYADTSGYIYVADYDNYRVQKFDRDSVFIVAVQFDEKPRSVAVSKDGKYMYVGFKEKVIKLKKPEIPEQPGGEQ